MSKKILIVLALGLASLAFACDSDEAPESGVPDTPLIDDLELRARAICNAACVSLTGVCRDAGDDIILDREIMRACRSDCRRGVYTVDELECLVAAECGDDTFACLIPEIEAR